MKTAKGLYSCAKFAFPPIADCAVAALALAGCAGSGGTELPPATFALAANYLHNEVSVEDLNTASVLVGLRSGF